MHSTFAPIAFPPDDNSFARTEWSRPPSSMKSRIGRKEKLRQENYQNRFLNNLRKAFDEADPEGTGYLTQQRWDSSGIREFLHDGTLTRPQFSLFFKRIDATSEGKVTWNKLIHYLLKVTNGSDNKKNHEAIQFIRKWPIPLHNKTQFHREMVVQILCSYKTNEYITISSDSVRFWNANDLLYKRMINDTSLFCCGLVFEAAQCLAIATTNRRLLFYNLETLTRFPIEVCASPSALMIKHMDQQQSLSTLKKLKQSEVPMFNIPTTLCIAESSIINTQAVPFFMGDDQGTIEVYNLMLPKRRAGTDFGISRVGKFKLHKGSITQVSAISAGIYASSGMDKKVVFFSMDPVKFTCQVLQTFVDTEPIVSFTYNIQQKCLATCGISRDAFIWSHGSGKKISKLGGHYNQVTKILSYTTTTKENYILTVTSKKEFRLYDSINYRLMKEWSDPQFLRPENRYSAVFFDPVRCQIIAAASQPVKWAEDAAAMNDSLDHRTHSHQIIGVFYAQEFNQLVTIDTVCSIKAWNIETGKQESSHMEPITEESSDISAASLDFNGRALITSTFNNTIVVWNYNSGSAITQLDLGAVKSPVSVIRCFSAAGRNYLVRAGWDKTIWLYEEMTVNNFELYRTFVGHTHDISDVQPFSGGLISSSVNGELLAWSFDTSIPLSACALRPESGVETMKIIDTTLIVGDSNGIMHILKIPKFEEVISFQAHNITVRHSLTSIEIDKKNMLLYSADTLGYVKKWTLFFNEKNGCYDVKDGSIFRCHRDEIISIALVKDGEFLATSSTDLCVRLFRTSDFSYVNYFSDETKWDLQNPQTWINEAPFIVDENHFKKGKNIFGQSTNGTIRTVSQKSIENAEPTDELVNEKNDLVNKSNLKEIKTQIESENKKPREEEQMQPNEGKKKEEKQEPTVDFEKFQKTFDEYIQNPHYYQVQSIAVPKETENIYPPPLKPIPPLELNSRPNELMSTIKKLIPLGEEEGPVKEVKKTVKLPILVPSSKPHRPKSVRKQKKYIDSNLYSIL